MEHQALKPTPGTHEATDALASEPLVGVVPADWSAARRASMRVTESSVGVPTFLVARRIDLTDQLQKYKEAGATLTDVLIIAVAQALIAVPAIHSCLRDRLAHHFTSTRVAVLVRAGDALLPIVFPDAETAAAAEIRHERSFLQGQATDKYLPANRMISPTFVISNLGRYDVDWFSAVLFPDTAATLAVGAIVASSDGGQHIRAVLTCDHRLVDGIDGAQFLDHLSRNMQHVALT